MQGSLGRILKDFNKIARSVSPASQPDVPLVGSYPEQAPRFGRFIKSRSIA